MTEKKETIVTCTIPLDSGFTHILFNLASQGYSHIYVEYYGNGDEGAIENMYLLKRGDVIEPEDSLPYIKEGYEPCYLEKSLKDVIEDVIYEKILGDATDWYNNEGGGGTLFISTEDYKFTGDHYFNVIREEHEHLRGILEDS